MYPWLSRNSLCIIKYSFILITDPNTFVNHGFYILKCNPFLDLFFQVRSFDSTAQYVSFLSRFRIPAHFDKIPSVLQATDKPLHGTNEYFSTALSCRLSARKARWPATNGILN